MAGCGHLRSAMSMTDPFPLRICLDCGATLSLGPATSSPASDVELRAAEIVADGISPHHSDTGACERCGWAYEHAGESCGGGVVSSPEFQAGWLARYIVEDIIEADHDASHHHTGDE